MKRETTKGKTVADQNNHRPIANDFLGLGPGLAEAFSARPLTAREVVQWLCACQERAPDLKQLQVIADHATGVIRALYLCWLVSAAESEAMVAQLNAVYHMRERQLSGLAVH